MKRIFILYFTLSMLTLIMIFVSTLPVHATEALSEELENVSEEENVEDLGGNITEPMEELDSQTVSTEAVTEPDDTAEDSNATEPNDTADDSNATEPDEGRMSLSTFIYTLWEDNKELAFSALSALLSAILMFIYKRKYLPAISNKLKDQDNTLTSMQTANTAWLEKAGEKLAEFENYNNISAALQNALTSAQLDRKVLVNVIKMQAGQINMLIEYSNLPQARKDKIFEGYQAQLTEINKLEESKNNDETSNTV